MMRVLVRVDASALLGTGHVMRCLALAVELKSRGHQVVFVMRLLAGHMTAQTRDAGFEVMTLTDFPSVRRDSQDSWIDFARRPNLQAQDAKETLALLPHLAWDWLIVDHYALGCEWHQRMSGVAQKLMAIDDQADRALQCNLLLNQNPGALASRYADLVPSTCLSLMGPDHALLRPEFSIEPANVPKRKLALNKPRILVSLGGADVGGMTQLVVLALEQAGLRGNDVTVVAGAHNPYLQAIESRCQSLGYLSLKSTDTMAKLMAHSDCAIGAGGVSMLERCAMGLPSITLVVAPNQRPGALAAQAMGAVLALDPQAPDFEVHLSQSIKKLLTSPEHWKAMSRAALAVCDGKGTPRVADTLMQGALTFREATMQDAVALHAWRNTPETRKHSGDGQAIGLEQHQHWLERVLANPSQRLWIASTAAGPIGVLRFDNSQHGTEIVAEISVYRVPGQSGSGWGRALIAHGLLQALGTWPALTRFDARISDDNLSSFRAFSACGFTASASPGVYQKNIERHLL